MSVDDIVKAQSIADSAIATMQRLEIPATPANYAIWYEYHAGLSPNLQRTIDVLISNRESFNETTLQDLYATFFSTAKEAQAVREISVHALATLQEIVGVADLASDDAHQFGHALQGFASKGLEERFGNLKNLIVNLVEESKSMAGRSEYVGIRMRESAGKIEALERNLENAILDSTMDGLTGVANRKSFDAIIRKSAGEAMNSGDDLAMLMIDIDHFKRVNDTWGHQTGDIVLRHLAKTLQKAVRGGDHVARYGGEEFAVILPNTNGQAAVSVAENIRLALAREPIQIELTPPITPTTVSIGAACYDPGEPLAEWVGRADAALYSAKRDGRDRVELNECPN
ncbi:MAG: GGDEF domain-containing protein [Terracidiphilus sp.]|jgi:diguanylate cyclase